MRKLILIPFFIFQLGISQETIDTTEVVSIRTAHYVNLKSNVTSYPYETVTIYKSGLIKTQILDFISISRLLPEDPFTSYNQKKNSPEYDKNSGLIKRAKGGRHNHIFKYDAENNVILHEKSLIQVQKGRYNIMRDYFIYKNNKLVKVDRYGIRNNKTTDSLHGRSIIYKYKKSL